VLTGVKVSPEDYLRYPYRQITVIAEGDDRDELLGWASLSPSKMSVSRSFPGHFLNRLFRPDARIQGGRRAMIMSGQYDKTIPMDIMPEYLIKAILGRDIENMEKLGIYEVAPEDFALAEYADTSKLPLQKIVREGLDYLRKELQ
ncbi:MAG: NADH:ubiquinone reductase (Na(+)-transporting) subunit A, partial [Muribaculaceae bacterium]|nr:NADH:ubiquinone reductase (Na(+)-transporting) subunit A [Muribaculaceae bacterium]